MHGVTPFQNFRQRRSKAQKVQQEASVHQIPNQMNPSDVPLPCGSFEWTSDEGHSLHQP